MPLLEAPTGGLPEIPAWVSGLQRDERFEVLPMRSLRDLLRPFDAIYIYFPEWMIRGRDGVEGVRRRAHATLRLLSFAKRRGAKILWHANNVIPHETDRAGVTDRFMRRFSAMVDVLVGSTTSALDEFVARYPLLRMADRWAIPMGHYRDFYEPSRLTRVEARRKHGLPASGRVAVSVGMIRRYKNQLELVDAFRAARLPDTHLVLAGQALDDGYLARLRDACAGASNITLVPGYLSDDDLISLLAAADFSVLAAPEAVKSGTAMLSLSFGTPALVPERGEFRDWADQLGASWVRTYAGGIRASVLEGAFAAPAPTGQPDLSRYFDWNDSTSRLTECVLWATRERR